MKHKIVPNQVFGRLTVISEGEPLIYKKTITRRFLCQCACGNKTLVPKGRLVYGTTKSCGCLAREKIGVKNSYEDRFPELYNKFKSMRSRCNNPNNSQYKNYGGRGIKCLFNDGFVKFVEYCLSVGWKTGLQIDRIDNNGNYEPGNIRFVSRKTNVRNRRVSVLLTAWGETKHIKDWEDDPRVEVSAVTIYVRLKNGWSPGDAITAPKYTHH